MGAVNAISRYGSAGRFDDLERWGGRLIRLAEAPAFAADREIRLREAMGAVNAISDYGNAGRFDDLERWGGRLIRLAEAPAFAADREIRLQEAGGANNALNALILHGRYSGSDARTKWRNRLAAIARDLPGALDIQHIAKSWGVSYADQMGFALRFPAPKQVAAKRVDKPPT